VTEARGPGGARFTVEIPGGHLAGEEAGAGDPVVLIHGLSFDRSMWDPQFPALAGHYRTVRYDLRGFGDSGVPAAAHGHVEDLLALLDALTIDRAHLVSLSLGANIALATVVFHPHRVRALVLASSGPRPPVDHRASPGRGSQRGAPRRHRSGEALVARPRDLRLGRELPAGPQAPGGNGRALPGSPAARRAGRPAAASADEPATRDPGPHADPERRA